MTAPTLLLTTFALFAPAPDSPAEANKKDLAKFQGTWTVQSVLRNGEEAKKDGDSVTFDGAKMTIAHAGSEEPTVTLQLDASKNPPTIDVTAPAGEKEMILGIYKFDGDALKMAWSRPGKPRPTEFASKPDSDTLLVVLKRDKK